MPVTAEHLERNGAVQNRPNVFGEKLPIERNFFDADHFNSAAHILRPHSSE